MPLDSWKNYSEALDTGQVPKDVLLELLRQAELRQEAIFRSALGMDQRASILSGGFAAAAGAIAAAALTLGQGHVSMRNLALFAAASLGLAAALCAYACRPQPFRFPGNPPNDWARDPSYMRDCPLDEILLAHIVRLQTFMHENEDIQRRNGWCLNAGLIVAAAGPLLACLGALASH